MTVIYEWRGEFTNTEVNVLHAEAFGTGTGLDIARPSYRTRAREGSTLTGRSPQVGRLPAVGRQCQATRGLGAQCCANLASRRFPTITGRCWRRSRIAECRVSTCLRR